LDGEEVVPGLVVCIGLDGAVVACDELVGTVVVVCADGAVVICIGFEVNVGTSLMPPFSGKYGDGTCWPGMAAAPPAGTNAV